MAYREEVVSWIHRHLDTSSASSSPVSERRSEFRYTVALPRGTQLVNTPPPFAEVEGKKYKGRRQEVGKRREDRARGPAGWTERVDLAAREREGEIDRERKERKI